MARYRAIAEHDEPPTPGTGVALAETLADDGYDDDGTVLGLVSTPTAAEIEEALADLPPAPGVIVQWDHGPRGFEYLEDLAVLVPDNDRAPA